MDAQYRQRIRALDTDDNRSLLRHIRRGIEKESLRITPDGRLSAEPHPAALGSALTHSHITTDYSEALLEFITDPGTELNETLTQLESLHRFTCGNIGSEVLWASSMPCILEQESEIPIARYGSSNVAQMKYVYRVGLANRYGRLMQTIAGIHYNFSFDDGFWEWLHTLTKTDQSLRDFKTEQYFALIRNFHRYSWLLVYLFGASPAVCNGFLSGRKHDLEPISRGTSGAPFGTSLRMGDLGYQSQAQAGIDISYNNLEDYVEALHQAIVTPHPDYERIGVRDENGDWLQLSTSLLQIENEFYAAIRPKRVANSGESPRHALSERGVEYVEVRCLDIDPFEPTGIAPATARFIDAFLVLCLLMESPQSDADARHLARENLHIAVMRGREPGVELNMRDGGKRLLTDYALELLEMIEPICGILDATRGGTEYAHSLAVQRAKIKDPELTPSARIIKTLRERDVSYFRFAMDLSLRHREALLSKTMDEAQAANFRSQSEESIAQQQAIEVADTVSFEDYIAAYFNQ